MQPRAGWAAASKAIACAEDDVLVLGEFANRSDDDGLVRGARHAIRFRS